MKRLLIGYDGSDCAKAALDDLRRAGLPAKLAVKVLTVADVWLPSDTHKLEPVYPDMEAKAVRRARAAALEALKQAEETAKAGCARVREVCPEWRVEAAALADSPAWAIGRIAQEWHADLVLVGSHGRSILERLFLGSVAQKVAVEAPCSVHVARPRRDRKLHKFRIMVAVDGSADSETAVRAVLNRDWRLDWDFRIVTVIDHRVQSAVAWPGLYANQWVLQHDKETKEWTCRIVESHAKLLSDAGLRVETHIYDGEPKQALLRAAKDLEVDCIFIGAHGLHHAGHLSLGTVALAVTNRAHCSVEIVRNCEVTMNKAKSRNTTNPTRLVELVASFPGAKSVRIAGTFNDWHPQVTEMINVGGDRWAKALSLPPGRYEYRFVVDGQWRDDPTASDKVANPFGTSNAVLNVLPEMT
jgi:nucleotide-binding universal stress UspA family protein